MNSIKNLKRIHRIHKLIQSECTGTPLELSNRFNISERLVYHLIEQLKDFEAPVGYDRSRRTYYYKKAFDLEVNLPLILLLGNLKETGHYVVLYKLENNYIIWLDPAIGELVHLSKEVLKKLWTGVYLEIKV